MAARAPGRRNHHSSPEPERRLCALLRDVSSPFIRKSTHVPVHACVGASSGAASGADSASHACVLSWPSDCTALLIWRCRTTRMPSAVCLCLRCPHPFFFTLSSHCVIDACMCTRYHASRESFLYLRDFYIGEIHPDDRASVPQVWGRTSAGAGDVPGNVMLPALCTCDHCPVL